MLKEIDLNGTWQLRWSNWQRGDRVERLNRLDETAPYAIDGVVPGCVHLDLMRAGLLAEPVEGLNCLAARWVEEFIWFYRRTFDAPSLKKGQRAWLVLPTLDLAAKIWLNGELVGRHANAFRPCRLEVTEHLKAGENLLLVELESGLYDVSDKSPGRGQDDVLHKRQWLRQTQSTFGWDWSERLLNVGIRGGASLEIWSGVRVDHAWAASEVTDDLSMGSVCGRVAVEGLDERTRDGVLTVELVGTGQTVQQPVQVKPGNNVLSARVELIKPRLWWPIGHGEPNVYEVRLRLEVDGQTVADQTQTVGFRRVEIDQSPHPDGGRYFVLEINNKRIFCKGGNFVPADAILARIDDQRYEVLVDRAIEANFNLLRIWGGGLYESDAFYDVCNRRGILVWQEFIFACEKYPSTDKAFYDNVAEEAVWQVRRLAHHPSMILWCGNNEIEVMFEGIDGQDRNCLADYGLYHLLLPSIVKREDGTRFYWPSSPYSGDCLPPNDDTVGDQHPWRLGFGDTDFRKYRQMDCRFANEGGFLGPTALPTVLACLPPDQRRIGSMAWEIHDNSVNSWGPQRWTDDMLDQHLGLAIREMSIEDYVYWAGVVQGEALTEYVRTFRRRMFDNAAAIFWMYNDCWPMVRSWTIVDYYLRRTPAFHPVRRAMAATTVAVVHDGEWLNVYGINEGPKTKATLRWGLFALSGDYPVDQSQTVELPANASTLLAQIPVAELESAGATTHGAFATLSRDGHTAAQDRLFLPLLKEMQWVDADVAVRHKGSKAIFESPVFAWRVCLDLDGETALPDNFFDILPGVPVTLDWSSDQPAPRVLRLGNGLAAGS